MVHQLKEAFQPTSSGSKKAQGSPTAIASPMIIHSLAVNCSSPMSALTGVTDAMKEKQRLRVAVKLEEMKRRTKKNIVLNSNPEGANMSMKQRMMDKRAKLNEVSAKRAHDSKNTEEEKIESSHLLPATKSSAMAEPKSAALRRPPTDDAVWDISLMKKDFPHI